MKERYLQAVRSLLDCPAAERERLMARLSGAVTAYLEDTPEADASDLEENFGTPEDCAARLLEECAPAALASERQRKNRRNRIVVGVLAALLAAALCLAGYLWYHGGLVTIETTIYENGIPDDFPKDGEFQVTYSYDN